MLALLSPTSLGALLLVAASPSLDDPVKSVEDYLASCELFGWSGAAVVVHDGEVVLHRGYGLADRAAETAIDERTVFEVASTTKPFTACAVLALAEDGVVDLDASIGDYLPGVPEDKRAITVRHLLAHTSGMPRTAGGGSGEDLEVAVRGFLSTPLARTPGEKHEYWNGGYALLAGIVEEVTDEGYLDYCRARIFERAKLRDTGFTGDELWPEARQAVGYSGGAPVRLAAEHPYGRSYGYQYRGMGGMVTSAQELWRLTEAVLEGKVLSPETVEQMLTVVDGSYGLGFARTTTKRGTTRIGHGGDVRGFHTQLQVFPDEDAAVVLLSNVDEVPMWHLAWNVEALLLGGSPPYPSPPEVLEVRERDLEQFEGTYAIGDGAGRVTVVRRGAGLELRAEDVRGGVLLSGGALGPTMESTLSSMSELVEAVAAGDPGPAERLLADRIPKSWPQRLVTEIYPAHEERWGELEAVTAVMGRELPGGSVEGIFALDHARGRAHVQVVYTAGRLSRFDLTAKAPASILRFAPVDKGRDGLRFATFQWSADPRSPRRSPKLSFEVERRKARAMLFTPPGGEELRLERQP